MGFFQTDPDVLHGYRLLSRKLGLFKGELPVPMEHIVQAKNAHTQIEPLAAHMGLRPNVWYKGVLHGYRHFWLARRAPWVLGVLP